MGSTRLPGKVLKQVCGQKLLEILFNRVKRSRLVDKVILATSTNVLDDELEEFCLRKKIDCFRGSEADVLNRYHEVAKLYNATHILRVTADCPLLDPDTVDEVVSHFLSHEQDVDYISTDLEPNLPRGMGCELFTIQALSKTASLATEQWDREHVTTYMKNHRDLFNCIGLPKKPNEIHKYRLTVDTVEDFSLIQKVLEYFSDFESFSLLDICSLLDKYPELLNINKNIKQKTRSVNVK